MSPIDVPTSIPTDMPTPSPIYAIPFYNKSFDEIVEILEKNATVEDGENGSIGIKPSIIETQFISIIILACLLFNAYP